MFISIYKPQFTTYLNFNNFFLKGLIFHNSRGTGPKKKLNTKSLSLLVQKYLPHVKIKDHNSLRKNPLNM